MVGVTYYLHQRTIFSISFFRKTGKSIKTEEILIVVKSYANPRCSFLKLSRKATQGFGLGEGL